MLTTENESDGVEGAYDDLPEREIGEGITTRLVSQLSSTSRTTTHSKIVFDMVVVVVAHVGEDTWL